MKDNKLIAEFMGKPYKQEFLEKGVGGVFEEVVLYEDLQYHTSWDWLMPVVYKILWLEDYEDESYEDIYNGLTNAILSQTFEAVVVFIKEYNQNK